MIKLTVSHLEKFEAKKTELIENAKDYHFQAWSACYDKSIKEGLSKADSKELRNKLLLESDDYLLACNVIDGVKHTLKYKSLELAIIECKIQIEESEKQAQIAKALALIE
tara:strand:+ start:1386 stop:1715 length:330 start_codon:yes stop_codon:yes gene_type:complete